jgi:hypothetical protein
VGEVHDNHHATIKKPGQPMLRMEQIQGKPVIHKSQKSKRREILHNKLISVKLRLLKLAINAQFETPA